MDFSTGDWIGASICGFIVGIISLLFGVGGGLFLVPTFSILLDFPINQATAISAGTMLFSATTGAIMQAIKGRLDVKMAVMFAACAVPGAIGGGYIATLVDNSPYVTLGFGVLMIILALLKVVTEIVKKCRAKKTSSSSDGIPPVGSDGIPPVGSDGQPVVASCSPASPMSPSSVSKKPSPNALPAPSSSLDNEMSFSSSESGCEIIHAEDHEHPDFAPTCCHPSPHRCLCNCKYIYHRHLTTGKGKTFDYRISVFPAYPFALLGGLLGGVLGLGGGVIYNPILNSIAHFPMELGVAVSKTTISIANPFVVLIRAIRGDMDGLWPMILCCGIFSTFGSISAAQFLHKLTESFVVIGFYIIVVGIGIKMCFGGVHEF
ncbi:Transmembrane protein TauE-like protein [Aduncisulcus paluster]|uniref:Transmembrane protein TauE-like protein n=1 Tax=Aduncisulcus paluster TaxID=2918883 RepID=A0ABQ5K365_9EUKA|nr:Transmembrane protein TauE-like protein [Aduncisulcus paluster]